jgi:hypothetical protein
MSVKSLTVAAALVLGIAGCDDPEVQDKVLSVLEHGAVQAQAHCYMPSGEPACLSTSSVSTAFTVTRFQDGSTFLNIVSNLDGRTTRSSDYYKRGDAVKLYQLNAGSPDPDEYVLLEDGELTVRGYCGSTTPAGYQTHILDLTADMTCTGFNLEAFGIDP